MSKSIYFYNVYLSRYGFYPDYKEPIETVTYRKRETDQTQPKTMDRGSQDSLCLGIEVKGQGEEKQGLNKRCD